MQKRFKRHALPLILVLLSYSTALTINELKNSPLIKEPTYKKCCNINQSLKTNETKIVCENNTLAQNLHYLAETVNKFPDDCHDDQDECFDFLRNQLVNTDCTTLNYRVIDYPTAFPKCCPLNHQYDLQEHKCVQVTSDELSNISGVVRVGLNDCEREIMAIVDHINLTTLKYLENNSISLAKRNFNSSQYCFDTNFAKNDEVVLRICQKTDEVCKLDGLDTTRLRCIKKCCADGYMYKLGYKCVPTYTHGININTSRITNSTSDKFGVIIATTKKTKYEATDSNKFQLGKYGELHVIQNKLFGVYNYKDAFYCIETYEQVNKNARQTYFLFLNKSTEDHYKFYVSAILLTISCISLILTLVVYTILPEMKNLHGKSIMLYCFILLIGFSTLALSIFIKKIKNVTLCTSIGFIIMFSFLGAFTWLNIICFDMWMAFGTIRVIKLHNKKRDLRRFIFYNFYGWGVPTLFTGFAFLVYQYEFLPEYLIPKFGKKKCFFSRDKNSYDHILYFFLPMTLLIICNCVLFIKTIAYYIKVKDEINRMNDNTNDGEKKARSFRNDREKLNMLLKLFLIMGISWVFEAITSFVSFRDHDVMRYIEYIWDVFNSLSGVYIFCIFILKKKVYMSLQNKFFPRRASEQSSTAATSLYSINTLRDFSPKRKTSENSIIN